MNLDELTDTMTTITSDDYQTSAQLMVQCLRVIPIQLPEVAKAGIDIGRRYWYDSLASKGDVDRARIECWNYLDERSASTNTDEPEYCAVRATICVLYPDAPSDNIGELIDFFNQMVRGTLPELDESDFTRRVASVVEEFSREQNSG